MNQRFYDKTTLVQKHLWKTGNLCSPFRGVCCQLETLVCVLQFALHSNYIYVYPFLSNICLCWLGHAQTKLQTGTLNQQNSTCFFLPFLLCYCSISPPIKMFAPGTWFIKNIFGNKTHPHSTITCSNQLFLSLPQKGIWKQKKKTKTWQNLRHGKSIHFFKVHVNLAWHFEDFSF